MTSQRVARAQIVEITWDFTLRQKAIGRCISFLLLSNKLSHITWLETTQNSRHGLNVLCVLRKLHSLYWLACISTGGLTGEECTSKPFRLLAESISLHLYSWGVQLLLAIGWRLPQVLEATCSS